MTLTNESTASQSKEPSKEGKELELCVNKEDMQITVRSLLQVPTRTSFILEVQFFENSTQIIEVIFSYKSVLIFFAVTSQLFCVIVQQVSRSFLTLHR